MRAKQSCESLAFFVKMCAGVVSMREILRKIYLDKVQKDGGLRRGCAVGDLWNSVDPEVIERIEKNDGCVGVPTGDGFSKAEYLTRKAPKAK